MTHCALNGTLHSATERNSLFKLASDILSNQLRVHFWTLDLMDVDIDVFASQELKFAFETFHFFTLLTNHDSGTGSVDVDIYFLNSAFDANLRDRSMLEALGKIAAQTISS
jgi:hypothetical protein